MLQATPTGTELIPALIQAVKAQAKEAPETCLSLIEAGLKRIGSVQEHLFVDYESLFSSTRVVRSTRPQLLDDQKRFTVEVGASLHFLKGEILHQRDGNTHQVLEEYKLAANLAPRNPFGARALFLEDHQSPSISSHIAAYRRLAIAWGAEP